MKAQVNMKNVIRRVLVAAFLVSSLALTACNTIEGAGEDVESVGESVSEASRDVRK
jgi:predicted small secreted protein